MANLNAGHRVYLSVGSNMGDKLENCLSGIAALTEDEETRLLAVSRFYRTSPVDFTDQDWFVNAAVKVATTLSAETLLDKLISIQRRMGRKADSVRFGPRLLDLDILLYDDQAIQTPRLIVPHPRMHKRAFVLRPVCDIDQSVVHPLLGKTMENLLGALDDEDQQVHPLENQPKLSQGRLA